MWNRLLVICRLLVCALIPMFIVTQGTFAFGQSSSGASNKSLPQVPPVWDKRLAANDGSEPCNSSRFTCVMGGEAVRDNETGLVWERSPDSVNFRPLGSGLLHCANRITGGRMGWRLPSVHELASLIEPTIADGGPRLPLGHPFLNAQARFYWTATAKSDDSAVAWGINFREGTAVGDSKLSQQLSWCVRGSGPIEAY